MNNIMTCTILSNFSSTYAELISFLKYMSHFADNIFPSTPTLGEAKQCWDGDWLTDDRTKTSARYDPVTENVFTPKRREPENLVLGGVLDLRTLFNLVYLVWSFYLYLIVNSGLELFSDANFSDIFKPKIKFLTILFFFHANFATYFSLGTLSVRLIRQVHLYIRLSPYLIWHMITL